jgi:hypothetical protein
MSNGVYHLFFKPVYLHPGILGEVTQQPVVGLQSFIVIAASLTPAHVAPHFSGLFSRHIARHEFWNSIPDSFTTAHYAPLSASKSLRSRFRALLSRACAAASLIESASAITLVFCPSK